MNESSPRPELSIGAPLMLFGLSMLLLIGLWGAARAEDSDIRQAAAEPAVAPVQSEEPPVSSIRVNIQIDVGSDATLDLLGDGIAPTGITEEVTLYYASPSDRLWLLVLRTEGRVAGLTLLPGRELVGIDEVNVSADTTAAALVALTPSVLVGDSTEHAERVVAAWSDPSFDDFRDVLSLEVVDGDGLLIGPETVSGVVRAAKAAELVAGPGTPVMCPGDQACPVLVLDENSVTHGLGAWVAAVDRTSGQVCGWLGPFRDEVSVDAVSSTLVEIAATARRSEVDPDAALDAAATSLTESTEGDDLVAGLITDVQLPCELELVTPNGNQGSEVDAAVIEVARGATAVDEVLMPLSRILSLEPPIEPGLGPVEMAGSLDPALLAALAEDQGAALPGLIGMLDPLQVASPDVTSEADDGLSDLSLSGSSGFDEAAGDVIVVLERMAAGHGDWKVGPTVTWATP